MRRKYVLILAVPALFILSIFFLMSDIHNIPENTAILVPPSMTQNEDQPEERQVEKPPKPPVRPPRPPLLRNHPNTINNNNNNENNENNNDKNNDKAPGRTLDDDLIRPFPRPGKDKTDDNNFKFDNEKQNADNINNNENNNDENKNKGDENTGGSIRDKDTSKETSKDIIKENYDDETKERQSSVRAAYLHAWKTYEQYAWGRDELQPPFHAGKDWLGMGMSIVDSIDTMYLMGLTEPYEKARRWIQDELRFDNNNRDISFFETTIRVVGGLLSIYDLTGDDMFLRKAEDLGERLMPIFETRSGLAKTTINLLSGHISNPGWTGAASVLSELGTVQMEFGCLTKHTGKTKFQEKSIKAYDVLEKVNKPDGLYPVYLDPDSGNFRNNRVTLGALGDSFYEYLLKYWILTGKKHDKYRRMYEEAMQAVIDQLIFKSTPSGLTYIAEKENGGIYDKMDHLVCFAGAMFALGAHHKAVKDVDKHMKLGEEITNTCHEFYKRTKTGLGPEIARFRQGGDFFSDGGHASTYILRPETVESYFVLYWLTGDKKYQDWGWEAFQAIEKHCRTPEGYCGVRDVNRDPAERDDVQQSFFMAETLKYLYLLFSPRDTIDLDKWVMNTEAHPLKVW